MSGIPAGTARQKRQRRESEPAMWLRSGPGEGDRGMREEADWVAGEGLRAEGVPGLGPEGVRAVLSRGWRFKNQWGCVGTGWGHQERGQVAVQGTGRRPGPAQASEHSSGAGQTGRH